MSNWIGATEDQPPITTLDMLKCAQREVSMRRRVYPGLVDRGRMSESTAAREIAIMEAIVGYLDDLNDIAEAESA